MVLLPSLALPDINTIFTIFTPDHYFVLRLMVPLMHGKLFF